MTHLVNNTSVLLDLTVVKLSFMMLTGRDKCTLVAHDWGGAIAWQFILMYPSWVETYVIMNAPHPYLWKKMTFYRFSQFKKSWWVVSYLYNFVTVILFITIHKTPKEERAKWIPLSKYYKVSGNGRSQTYKVT